MHQEKIVAQRAEEAFDRRMARVADLDDEIARYQEEDAAARRAVAIAWDRDGRPTAWRLA